MTNDRLEQIKQIRAYGLQAEPTALLLAIDDLLSEQGYIGSDLERAQLERKALGDFTKPASEGAAVSASPTLPDKCECGHKWHGDDACQWKGREEDTELHCMCPESHRTLTSKDFQSVSVSPQPRCPKCGNNQLRIDFNVTDGGKNRRHYVVCKTGEDCGYRAWVDDLSQFFAAAPAHTEPDYNRAYTILGEALNLNPEFYGLVEMAQVAAKRLTGKYDVAAQEQPVDNSPQPKVLTAAQVLDASDEYCRTKGNPALAPVMRESFRKHREMPRAVLTSLNLKPVVMYETKPPSPQKGKP